MVHASYSEMLKKLRREFRVCGFDSDNNFFCLNLIIRNFMEIFTLQVQVRGQRTDVSQIKVMNFFQGYFMFVVRNNFIAHFKRQLLTFQQSFAQSSISKHELKSTFMSKLLLQIIQKSVSIEFEDEYFKCQPHVLNS